MSGPDPIRPAPAPPAASTGAAAEAEQAQRYLAHYRATRANTRGGGPLGRLAGMLRDRLDAKARAQGQADRFGLFLPRALALAGIADQGPLAVMELGAGDGWALSCTRLGLSRIAVDAADAFAADFAARGIAFHVRDIAREKLPAADGTIDFLMMNHVIEHIAEPLALLAECRRVLRPGGGLYLRTPDILRVGHQFWDDYTHVRPYTHGALRAACIAAGFSPLADLHSDHTRISLDLLTDGRWRGLLFGRRWGGAEIEASFRRD
ncbi:MAG: class I SAM-dependent methyltransferase [Alphaproteobacteria bacterium]|nr:class I SAM-dependent methyltransferase [Alphaproteobacteria bacterium]